MLYMTILSWDPDKRDAVIERTKKLGFEHEGEKVLGTWVDVYGARSFQLVDVPRDIDPIISLKNHFAWNDVMKIESVPVIEGSEMMKFLASMK